MGNAESTPAAAAPEAAPPYEGNINSHTVTLVDAAAVESPRKVVWSIPWHKLPADKLAPAAVKNKLLLEAEAEVGLGGGRGGGGGGGARFEIIMSSTQRKTFRRALAERFDHVQSALAGVSLRFSTFGQPDGCDVLLEAVTHARLSVGDAWELLSTCGSQGEFERRVATLRAQSVQTYVNGPPGDDGIGADDETAGRAGDRDGVVDVV